MHVKLKKKFGQNFLVDKNILKKINKLIPRKTNSIIEIGPGIGHLTDLIIKNKLSKISLIEIDSSFIEILKSKYKEFQNILIINKDIMKIDLLNYNQNELIISNLPYNISSQILVKINNYYHFEMMILMFQKEFADRLISEKLNNLNCLIKCFYNIKKKFNVSKNSFYPCPKIDSTVLTFNKKKRTLINYSDLKLYSEFKSMIFVNKRKKISTILKKNNIKFINNEIHQKRVDQLTLENFVILFKNLKPELINKFC